MTSPSTKVWLRSSLLERLTDHHPERRREAPEAQRVDHAMLKSLLLRDLSWLFNTTYLSATLDLSAYPEVERSVLNYGIPALTGRTLSGLNEAQLKQHILEALTRYESRLVRGTIDVHVHAAPRASGGRRS